MKKWFESWFNTEYYHLLYGNRNDDEAKEFLSVLMQDRNFKNTDVILDLACGKGRHARFLNSQGYNITGVDLSSESIKSAKKFENDRLTFFTHDMLEPMNGYSFDFVLNLFTSFGYFDDPDDNIKMLDSVKSYLKDDGELIIDFMNASKIEKELVDEESKVINGITFNIKRQVKDGFIEKEISFNDMGIDHCYVEKVRNFKLGDFSEMLEKTNFEIIKVAGDYKMQMFDENLSDRLILCARIKA